MNILILNGSIDINSLPPFWVINIDSTMEVQCILSILQVPKNYRLTLNNAYKCEFINDLSKLTMSYNIYPAIMLVDEYSYLIDHYLDCYIEYKYDNMYNTNQNLIESQAVNIFMDNIKYIEERFEPHGDDKVYRVVMNRILSDKNKFYIVYGILLEYWNIDAYDLKIMYITATGNGYTPILVEINRTKPILDYSTYSTSLKIASFCGYADIVELLIGNDRQVHLAMQDGVEYEGNIIIPMVEFTTEDFNDAVIQAIEGGGYIDIIRLLLHGHRKGIYEGADNYNEAMIAGARYGYIEVVEMMIAYNYSYNEAIIEAARSGHTEIVKLLLEYEPTKYIEAKIAAVEEGHNHIVELIDEWEATLVMRN